jgi:hypothetical protein
MLCKKKELRVARRLEHAIPRTRSSRLPQTVEFINLRSGRETEMSSNACLARATRPLRKCAIGIISEWQ